MRYLLLLDFRAFDKEEMQSKYVAEAKKLRLDNPVCVVHVSRGAVKSYSLVSQKSA